MICKQRRRPLGSRAALGPASLGPVNCHSWNCLICKFFCQVSVGAQGSFSPLSKSGVSRGLELASPLKSSSKETWAARPALRLAEGRCDFLRFPPGLWVVSSRRLPRACLEPAAEALPRDGTVWKAAWGPREGSASRPAPTTQQREGAVRTFSPGQAALTTLVFTILSSCQSNLVSEGVWGKIKPGAKVSQGESWNGKQSS